MSELVLDNNKCSCMEDLSEEELLERFSTTIDTYKGKKGALIPLLQIAQSMFGYLPEKAMKLISTKLDKPYSEVAGVVSFYSFFSIIPRGKHVVRVCMGTACYVKGNNQILDVFKEELGIDVGNTTDDRQFTLEVCRCFGACGLAPAITIDDEVFGNLKPSKVNEILSKYKKSNS